MKRRLVILLAATLALLGREARAGETSLGIDVGYVKPKRIEATLFFNGNFRFHLSRRFALEPEFSYWRKSSSALAVTASLEDLQFGANLLAVVPVGRTVEVFGGGGGGLHQITGNLAAGGNNAVSDSITQGGVDLQAGADVKASGGLSFFLGARYDWVLGLSGADPRRLDQMKFFGGFRVRF
jgi:hypothetical protein